jgi:hypothetical protein
MSKKVTLVLIAAILLCIESVPIVLSQTSNNGPVSAPATEWQQEYEGDIESVSNVVQTSDGGYAFLDLGWAHQITFVPSTIYKVNSSGTMQWKKTIRSFGADGFVQTSDGGFEIFGGWSTYGTTYQFTPAIVKIDSQGNVEWVENKSAIFGEGLVFSEDGGLAALSGGGNLAIYERPSEAIIIKTNSYGIMQWNKTYAEPANFSVANSMIQTSDGGYALIGSTSFNGTNDTPNLYYWLAKTDSQGNLLWSRQYGNGPETVDTNQTQNAGAEDGVNRRTFGDNEGLSVTETIDGGFVAAGIVYPVRNYSWWGFSYEPIPNMAKTFLVKTDSQGNMEWNQTFDGYETSPIVQTSDGGFAFAVLGDIIKTDANGNIEWKKDVTFPSLGTEPYGLGLSSLIETSDGALVGVGVGTTSEPWWGDIYLIKTEAFLPLPSQTPLPPPMPKPSATPLPTLTVEATVIVSLIIGAVVGAGLLVYFKKRKS